MFNKPGKRHRTTTAKCYPPLAATTDHLGIKAEQCLSGLCQRNMSQNLCENTKLISDLQLTIWEVIFSVRRKANRLPEWSPVWQ